MYIWVNEITMVKNLLTICFLLFGLSLSAQLSVTPDPLMFSADTSEVRAEFHFTVTNNRSNAIQFYWNIDRGNSIDQWIYAVCDVNQCHLDGVESCPCPLINTLQGGESFEFSFYLLANGNPGEGEVKFNLTSDCEGNNIILDFPISVASQTTTSIEDVDELAEGLIKVYPNPTSSYFKIKNDENVSEILISNIVGKRLMVESHTPKQSHDVSTLSNGVYFVRLVDRNNNIIDVKRITIE